MQDLEVYQCVVCRSGSLVAEPGGDFAERLKCAHCGARYPIQHNILDTLIQPLPDAVRELQGMAVEAGIAPELWQSVRVRQVESIATFTARLQISESDTIQYYQQTQAHFEQALRGLGDLRLGRVLEVGSETDYFFLQYFRERGATCHAINLFFQYMEPDPYLDWPEKALADMNRLPFQAGAFDLVLFSATLHHSSDLEQTMREVERVLKPGGVALILSEQIGGWLKSSSRYHHRNDLIHETYHSFWKFHTGFVRAGFEPRYLFSQYFAEKLSNADINPNRRFARLGKTVAGLWKLPGFQALAHGPLLYPAHLLFGFPLNAILRKPLLQQGQGAS